MNPTLLVEVSSDRTEAYDRGEKFAHYRQIPSLRQYMLVSHRVPRIEVYTLHTGDEWVARTADSGATIPLASSGVVLEVDAVYADVDLEA